MKTRFSHSEFNPSNILQRLPESDSPNMLLFGLLGLLLMGVFHALFQVSRIHASGKARTDLGKGLAKSIGK
jgi:hypothetical protein